MIRKPFLWIAFVIAFLVIFGFIGGMEEFLWAMNLTKEIEVKRYNPKIESVLQMLAEKYRENRAMAQNFAYRRRIPLEDGRVTVILVPPVGEGASAIDQTSLISYKVTVEAISRHLIRARVPVSALDKIADTVEGVTYIRRPLVPVAADTTDFWISEGVAKTGANNYHDLGYEGQGTKVAVIDTGFLVWEEARVRGQLGSKIVTKDFTGEGIGTGTRHGTKAAEVVHDMAPEAELYLIKIADEVDLEKAKDYCIDQRVNIISHSHVWVNTNFTDGRGIICDIANDVRAHGILWVNAAGNFAQTHYEGIFTDTDGDNWHEFSLSPIDEGNEIEDVTSGGSLNVYLTWDSWPVTDQDYDLYLLDGGDNIVARSENRQTGNQPPTEEIRISEASGPYYIAVKKYSATGSSRLRVHPFHKMRYSTAAQSVLAAADATEVMAVGAIDQANWDTGPQEPYSSQGPTSDGRIKPDICGPTGVTTYAGGPKHFGGTSAAAPHVAGAAALLLSRKDTYTPAQLQETLENWAIDMGTPGEDNIYGYGRLMLEVIPVGAPSLSWTGEVNYTSDGLDPETGTSSTDFTYRVKYSDEDNDPPAVGFPRVHILKEGSEISGSPFTMNEVDSGDTTYSDGKLYTYSKTGLIPGTDYIYHFEAEDIHGIQATGDPVNVVDGPDISEEIPVLEVDPAFLGFGEVKVPQTKTMTFRAYNTGAGTLSGTISDDRDWIMVDPTSLTGNDNTISVTVDTDVMEAELWKEYTGTVTVASNGGTQTVSVSVTPTCVKVYPNPFNPGHSRLTFWGSGVPHAKIKIYTASGELVKTIHETEGEDKVYWDGKNEEGNLVVTGIYLFVANNPGERDTGKFTVIRKP